MNIGIIGAGWIAAKLARTLKAIWTRYQPVRQMIQNVLDEGVIGRPQLVTASLCYPMPLDETLEVMRLMDRFRRDCGVVYPMD